MSLEVWKPIFGFEGLYDVSTWGRVRHYDTRKIVYQETHCKGYMRVDLFKNGNRYHRKVHRLVAEAFVSNPCNKPQVNHIDGNNQNNSYTNLEWVTNAENAAKAKSLRKTAKREEDANADLNVLTAIFGQMFEGKENLYKERGKK